MRILKKDIRNSKKFKKIQGTENVWRVVDAPSNLNFYFYLDRAWFDDYSKPFKLKVTYCLNDHFINWQNPSQEEIVMFELQTGIKYLDYWLGLREE